MSPSKRPPPAEAVSPRSVAETVGRGISERVKPPETPFREDIVDEVHSVLKSHIEGPCELGVYVEADDQSAPARLGGKPRTIAFDETWREWFTKFTPELRSVVFKFAEDFHDKDRQTALVELADERIERRVLRNFFRRLWHAGLAAVVASFVGAHWFSEQIGWIVEKLPVFKAFWTLVTGART
jgi:hypothetical protein